MSVIAFSAVALFYGGALLALAWSLVNRADRIGELLGKLAEEQGKRKAQEAESDRITSQLEIEIERAETLADAIIKRSASHTDPSNAIDALGVLLRGWRERATATKVRLSANRELRSGTAPSINRSDALHGREEARGMPNGIGVDPFMPADNAEPLSTSTAKDKRP